MLKITPELIQKAKEYYDIEGLTTTPFWKDECSHSADSYVCSFIVNRIHDNKVFDTKFDLYIFKQKYYGQEICLRNGNEPGEYYSPGSVTDFISRNRFGTRWYRSVADLLCYIGNIKWELRN
jgi:hypothetical protein